MKATARIPAIVIAVMATAAALLTAACGPQPDDPSTWKHYDGYCGSVEYDPFAKWPLTGLYFGDRLPIRPMAEQGNTFQYETLWPTNEPPYARSFNDNHLSYHTCQIR